MIGGTLLHYKILETLGRGGMGEVYAALDSRLNRRVALKVLPHEVADDAERRARFQQEARAVATLNHPNIVTIHSVEQSEGTHFITMELVEGQTLADVIPAGGLPLEVFFRLAIPLADALSAAHERGITHRDLKPTNIMVSRDGRVKVLDFGLAKVRYLAEASDGSELPTASMTEAGRIVGTVSYLSPEQAEGTKVDHRTDVFSLGIVFYQMLTGRHPFAAATPAATVSAILKDTPPSVTELKADVPNEVSRVVRRCLSKEPGRRYQSSLDLRNDLEEIREERLASPGGASTPALSPPRPSGSGVSWKSVTIVAAILGAAVLVGVLAQLRRAPAKREVTRFTVAPPEGEKFGTTPGAPMPAVSPDGRHVVFVASAGDVGSQLWVRALDSVSARILPETRAATYPFWSPDGMHIGFFADGKLKKSDLSGGPPQPLGEGGGGGSWSRDGVILFGGLDGLYRVSPQGGTAARVTALDAARGELSHQFPCFLPDGRRFLYLVNAEEPENRGLYAGSLDSNEKRLILRDSASVVYAPPGYLFFVRENSLLAQAFDPTQLELAGDPVTVADRVMPGPTSRYAPFSVSPDVLAYRQGGWSFTTQLTWMGRTGREQGTLGAAGVNEGPSLSADEKRLTVSRFEPATNMDLWTIDLSRNLAERLTADPGFEFHAVWSPDAEQVAFNSSRKGRFGIYRKPASGIGADQLLFGPPSNAVPHDWTPDGRSVLAELSGDIWVVPVSGDQPFPLLQTRFNESQPRVSPDGRWVAYTSDETGAPEVYVQEFRKAGKRWRISTHGGLDPRWRGDGREIFYLEPGPPSAASHVAEPMLIAVGVRSGPTFEPGPPQSLFRVRVPDVWMRLTKTYAVASQGQRFLFDKVVVVEPSLITVVLNWKDALFP